MIRDQNPPATVGEALCPHCGRRTGQNLTADTRHLCLACLSPNHPLTRLAPCIPRIWADPQTLNDTDLDLQLHDAQGIADAALIEKHRRKMEADTPRLAWWTPEVARECLQPNDLIHAEWATGHMVGRTWGADNNGFVVHYEYEPYRQHTLCIRWSWPGLRVALIEKAPPTYPSPRRSHHDAP